MVTLRNSERVKPVTYLWSQDVEVPGPVGAADKLTFVLRGDARVFRNPSHSGAQSVGVQAQTIERFTLLLAEALTWRCKKQPPFRLTTRPGCARLA